MIIKTQSEARKKQDVVTLLTPHLKSKYFFMYDIQKGLELSNQAMPMMMDKVLGEGSLARNLLTVDRRLHFCNLVVLM